MTPRRKKPRARVAAPRRRRRLPLGEKLEAALDAVITVDRKQKIVLFNNAAEVIFRCPADEAVGGPLERFIPARFRKAYHNRFARFEAASQSTRMMGARLALSGLRSDGEEFPAEVAISQFSAKGRTFYTVILRDMTERKAAEVALERSHRELKEAGERLNVIIQSAMDAIITVDESQKVVMFNAAAEKAFGCAAANAVGGPLDRFIPERFRAAHREHVRHFGRTGTTTRMMGARLALLGLRASGEEFPIDASISQVTVEGRKLYTVILRDITHRVQAEAQIRRERDTAQRYLDVLNVMLVALDAGGNVTLINHKGCKVLGYREEEIVGQPWFDRFLPESVRKGTREVFGQIMAGETQLAEFYENPVLTRGGEERTIAWHNRDLTDERGRITGVLSSGIDVTERKAAEIELQRSYRELRELSTAMHEVREAERLRVARELHDELAQWLTALKMDVSWLSSRLPPELAPLVQRTEKMKGLVDTTVAAVRRIAADLRPAMLDDLGLVSAMESLLHDLSERTGIIVSLDTGAGEASFPEPLASGLYRIAQEALTNVARHAGATEVRVGLRVENGNILLTVRDNGRGYDPGAAVEKKSFGVLGMLERARTLGGTGRIERLEAGGTLVEVVLPAARYLGEGRA